MKTPAHSRTLKLGALVLGAVVAGSLACGRLQSERSHHDGPAAVASGAAAPANAARATKHLDRAGAPGLLHVYGVRYEQRLSFAGANGAADAAGVDIRLGGKLGLAYVEPDEGKHVLYAELTNVALDVGSDAHRTAELAREIARPFYVIAEPDGRVRGYAFARDLSHTARNVLRELVGGTQIAAHDDAERTLAEDDIHGSYHARYVRGADGAVTKTKAAYERVATMSAVVPADQSARMETSGEAVARVGEDGFVTSVKLDESQKASLGEGMPTATARIHAELALETTRADASLFGRYERDRGDLVRVGPFGTGDEDEARRGSDTRIVAGRSLDDLVARVRGGADDGERGALGAQLSARLRLTPEDATRAAALAKTLPERDARWVVGGLSGAGTPAAVRALGDVMSAREVAPGVRAQAATALAFSGANASEARGPLMTALDDATPEVRDSAALALGNVARELGDDAPAVGELADRYRNATTDDDRATFLRALGNSGSPDVLPLAKDALASASEPLREAAVQSLRFLPTGEADSIIDATLASDGAETVRQAAADAIGFRLVEVHAAALDRAVTADPSGRVRAEVVAVAQRALAKRGASLPDAVRAALRALLEKAPPPSE